MDTFLFQVGPIELSGGVVYYPQFIPLKEADELLTALLKLEWRQHVYHRTGPAPRLYVWMGEPYQSPNSTEPIVISPWTEDVLRLKALVEDRVGCASNSVNLNLYRDHHDSIAPHSDSPKEGLWNSPIASISLGAERKFIWRSKKSGLVASQVMEHGSLLIMNPGFQADYEHEVPKQKAACGPRINLTFRVTPEHADTE